jgi:aldehyde dehydrogenase family 7 protein A1
MLPRLRTLRTSTHRRLLSTHASAVFARLGLSTTDEIPGVYNGSWGGTGSLQPSLNPSTGETLALVRQASSNDVEATLAASRAAYRVWRHVPAPKRGEVLRQIRGALSERIDDLGDLVSLEMGKIRSEGKGEVQEIVDVLDYAVGLSRSFGGTVVPSEREKHFITEVANPLGVVGVVSGSL